MCETQMVARRNQQLASTFTANDKSISGHEVNKCFDNFASQADRLGILSLSLSRSCCVCCFLFCFVFSIALPLGQTGSLREGFATWTYFVTTRLGGLILLLMLCLWALQRLIRLRKFEYWRMRNWTAWCCVCISDLSGTWHSRSRLWLVFGEIS